MTKKLTIEFVKESFAERGLTVQEVNHVNSKALFRITFKCENGHIVTITWRTWVATKSCPSCTRGAHTYGEVKLDFESKGYTLISTDYSNNYTKLITLCPNGHQYIVTYHSWSTLGYRCKFCNNYPTYNLVADYFISKGCTLLSKEYVHSDSKLQYLCPNGHLHECTWNNFRSGLKCPFCSKVAKPTYAIVSSSFSNEGYTLLSTEYVNSYSLLNYICPLGHIHTVRWSNWHNGTRCPTCSYLSRTGEGSPNWRQGISFEEYCAAWQDKDYKYEIKVRDGHRCLNPYCSSKHPEKVVLHHINYDKKDCHFKNLVTVCNSCNSKANFDREWHTSWYQAILKQRYNYKY